MAAARAGHGPVAAGALQWGEPVLESRASGIEARGPLYRGHLAVELARRDVGFERVAELLWGTALPEQAEWEPPAELGAPVSAVLALLGGRPRSPLAALLAVVPGLAARELSPLVRDEEVERRRARAFIRQLAAWAGLPRSVARCREALGARSVAHSLVVALGAQGRGAARELNRALVLLADHELNASSFAARVAASAQADLLACLTAALATFSGPRHGAECDRVEALVKEVGQPREAVRALTVRAARGDATPGFGHRLYPGGDPAGRAAVGRGADAGPGLAADQGHAGHRRGAGGVHGFEAGSGLRAGRPLRGAGDAAGERHRRVRRRPRGRLGRPRPRAAPLPCCCARVPGTSARPPEKGDRLLFAEMGTGYFSALSLFPVENARDHGRSSRGSNASPEKVACPHFGKK